MANVSLFTKIMVHFLDLAAEAIFKKSLDDDQKARSYSIKAFENMGVKRDFRLSEYKRTELTSLKVRMNLLVNSDHSASTQPDEKIYEQLQKLLRQCFGNINRQCKAKNKDTGTAGPALISLYPFLDTAYEKICDMKLSDVPFNNEPLSCLQYCSAMSCVHDLYEEHFEKKTQDFEWLARKECLIQEQLEYAITDVKPENSPDVNLRRIKERAIVIQDKNKTIHIEFALRLGGSYRNEDYLDIYMSEVISTVSPKPNQSFGNSGIKPAMDQANVLNDTKQAASIFPGNTGVSNWDDENTAQDGVQQALGTFSGSSGTSVMDVNLPQTGSGSTTSSQNIHGLFQPAAPAPEAITAPDNVNTDGWKHRKKKGTSTQLTAQF
jgi:hypothetical protein